MIFGIGIDLVDIRRMASSLDRHGDRLAQRLLTEEEFDEFRAAARPASFLAKRFAAKEAMAKALGTGFSQQLSLRHLQISNDGSGKPEMICKDRALTLLQTHGINAVHLTISDERDNAIALVVLETAAPALHGQV